MFDTLIFLIVKISKTDHTHGLDALLFVWYNWEKKGNS